jgi:hypothetical protein
MLLLILSVVMLFAIMAAAYLLGFRLGGQKLQDELLRVRLDSIDAQRELHRLTREAFVAMAEHADTQRRIRP